MKIVCDDKIPYIEEALKTLSEEVVFLSGKDISRDDVKDADALIVRTRTLCNEALLDGTAVRFVGTATIGYDHLDTDYLEKRGIYWTNCPGCNADSVCQYVVESLNALVQNKQPLSVKGAKFAVVGHGNVGSRVAKAVKAMGCDVVVYDPFLFPDTPIDELYDAKFISFHTPMTFDGAHPTYHMADRGFFSRLTNCPVVINTARGPVVETDALIEALDKGIVSEAIVDVWENEPGLSLELMNRCFIATPHIAGYSANGKVNADNMIVEALCRYFNKPLPPKILPPDVPYVPYNPLVDHKHLTDNPADFEKLRGDYPIRLEAPHNTTESTS